MIHREENNPDNWFRNALIFLLVFLAAALGFLLTYDYCG